MFNVRKTYLTFVIALIALISLSLSSNPIHAANCDGLPVTAGVLPAGTYTLTDNCVTTGTIFTDVGVTTINGNGFTIDGNNTHALFAIDAIDTLNLNNVTIQNGNGSGFNGGAIRATGVVNITNSTVRNNTSPFDGGAIIIDAGGVVTITNSTVSDNTAPNDGGVVANYGTLNIVGSAFSGNMATVNGGVINNQVAGVLTISNSRFIGNSANTYGGAINNVYTMANVTISNSVFTGNTADVGGAYADLAGGTISFINSTLSGNTATTQAAAIFSAGTLNLTASTIAQNTNGGGDPVVYNVTPSNGTATNSIISGNLPFNCLSIFTDSGGNFENTNSCGFGTGANTDPMLGAFNGLYHPLLTGSPAIDTAPTCAGLTTDQIGNARPLGGACDSGAIETMLTDNAVVPVAIPGTPPLNQWNGEYPEEDRAEAYAVDDNVYATIHMQNGAWQYNAGGIPQDLIDYGVILAIDVWEQGGDQYFDNYERVCLLGEGRLIFFDATQSPRPMTEILPVDFEDGYTCGWIPNAGTVVLIDPE